MLNRPIRLVLNRNWQAINASTPQHAFLRMTTDVATALDIDGENMAPVRWAEWVMIEKELQVHQTARSIEPRATK